MKENDGTNFNSIYANCPRCTGKLKPLKKVIETVSPEHNYEMRLARLHKCNVCGERVFVREESS